MNYTLLKNWGEYKVGETIELKDKAVIEEAIKQKVIEPSKKQKA